MPIRISNDVAKKQQEMEDLLVELGQGPNPKAEARLMVLYQEISGFRPDCPVCICGRKLFASSLVDVANGDMLEASAKMRAAMKSVTFKWSQFKERFKL